MLEKQPWHDLLLHFRNVQSMHWAWNIPLYGKQMLSSCLALDSFLLGENFLFFCVHSEIPCISLSVSIIIWHLAATPTSCTSYFFPPPPSAPSWEGKGVFICNIRGVCVVHHLMPYVGHWEEASLGDPHKLQTLILLCLFSFL